MRQSDSTTTINHLDYLDGWRGLAIAFLLIGHFFPVPGINIGTVGVNLFFVLSGYLMGQLLFIKKTPLPVFYRRRISRIVPAHIFFIISLTIFYFATGRSLNFNEIFAALVFMNNYFPGDIGNTQMPFGHIWSLSVEEHSYVLLSVIAILSRKIFLDARITIIVFTVISSYIGFFNFSQYTGTELYARSLRTEVMAFGIFASTSFLLSLHKTKPPKLPTSFFASLVITGIFMHWWSIPDPWSRTIGVGLLAFAVNLLIVAPNIIKQALSLKPLKMMGLWSFSIYLWQQPFYLEVHRNGMSKYLAVFLAISCGVVSFYLIERPIRYYLNNTWGTSRESANAVTK